MTAVRSLHERARSILTYIQVEEWWREDPGITGLACKENLIVVTVSECKPGGVPGPMTAFAFISHDGFMIGETHLIDHADPAPVDLEPYFAAVLDLLATVIGEPE